MKSFLCKNMVQYDAIMTSAGAALMGAAIIETDALRQGVYVLAGFVILIAEAAGKAWCSVEGKED